MGPSREKHIEQQSMSGLSKKEYAERNGIPAGVFYGWGKKRKVRESVEPSHFVRVSTAQRIEIELSSGTIVRVAKEDLKSVLEALK